MQFDKQSRIKQTKSVIVTKIRESISDIEWIRGGELDDDCLEALELWKEGLLRAMPHVKEDWND